MHEPITIKTLQSGCYNQQGLVYGYEKDQIICAGLGEEIMSPRTANQMLRLGWAEEVKL